MLSALASLRAPRYTHDRMAAVAQAGQDGLVFQTGYPLGVRFMVDIIVEVRGGVVVEVYSKDTSLRVAVVDWDNIDAKDQRARVVAEPCASYETLPDETRRITLDSQPVDGLLSSC